ncbi:hypothetical protein ACWD4G_27940 [Streptomyces sp. NPDC002643]
MSARTHPRSHPATTGGVAVRLPWWALALPAVGFVTLLLLILNPGNAQAASGGPVISLVVEHIRHALPALVP